MASRIRTQAPQSRSFLVGAMSRRRNRARVFVAVFMASALALGAQTPESDWPDLAALGRIEVVSVARRETRLDHTAAAISVITGIDIDRSGATSLPQLLRLVPGVDVAQVGSTTYGVGVRGFGSEQSNKLLVMVDNRSLYNPVFAGTSWSVENFFLQDIDRIEVVRGPGGAAWGANAVNGVIHVVNKAAADTLGGLLAVNGSTEEGYGVAARYGVKLDDHVALRVYIKRDEIAATRTPSGDDAGDSCQNTRGGFRLDWTPAAETQLSITGEYYEVDLAQRISTPDLASPTGLVLRDRAATYQGGFIQSRFSHTLASGGHLSMQASVDKGLHDSAVFSNDLLIVDYDAQYSQSLGTGHQITGGFGYRLTHDSSEPERVVVFEPASASNSLFSAFLQDECLLIPERLNSLVGVRVEHHEMGGWDVQPTFRLLYTPSSGQSFWVGASRAVRIPSRVPTQGVMAARVVPAGGAGPLPLLVELRGDPLLGNEILWSYELGYRVQLAATLSIELNLFHNEYRDLIQETLLRDQIYLVTGAGPDHLVLPGIYANSRDARSNGGELTLTWRPAPRWSITGHCSYVDIEFLRKPSGVGLERDEAYTPKWIGGLRSSIDLGRDWQFTADFRHSGERPSMPMPAYDELDLKLRWKLRAQTELSLVGQNLLHGQHAESYPLTANLRPRELARVAYAQLTWHF